MDWTVPVSPLFPPFPALSPPFSSPDLGEGERRGQGWINMHAGGKMGVGITGRGPSGISKGGEQNHGLPSTFCTHTLNKKPGSIRTY